MKQVLNFELESDNLAWLKQVKEYMMHTQHVQENDITNEDIIIFCIQWFFVRSQDIMESNVRIIIPHNVLSKVTLNCLLDFMNEIEHTSVINHNIEEIERMIIDSNEQEIDDFNKIEDVDSIMQDIEQFVKTPISLELDRERLLQLTGLKAILEKQRSERVSYEEAILTCIMNTVLDLELQGQGFILRAIVTPSNLKRIEALVDDIDGLMNKYELSLQERKLLRTMQLMINKATWKYFCRKVNSSRNKKTIVIIRK